MSTQSARILYHDTFDGKGFTNENSLVNAYLISPDTIDPVITHLLGKENKKFPLSFLSEGQKGEGDMAGSIPVNDIQYNYDVIGRIDRPDYVVSSPYTSGDKPGLGGTQFFVTFRTNWLKRGFTVESPSQKQCRVISYVQDGLHWRYTLEPWATDVADYVSLADLTPGTKWGMVGGANVAQSLSFGNESNVVAPGKMKQQLSILRKSYRIGGNISNKTVEVQFDVDGQKTNLWMNWEQWLHNIQWKQDVEEHCWYSVYNRLPDGTIINKDEYSGLPIPRMAGLIDQIPNSDTFSFLTAKKIKNTVRDVMYGATDTGVMDVVLFCGLGFAEEFDTAMKEEASGFTQVMGDKFVSGSGRNLILGGFFNQYQHIDGHVVTVKLLPLLDHGGRAQVAERHPITGLPMTSYEAYFVDMSVYDGKRNLVMLHEKGRSMKTGVLRGMADVPMNFGGNAININLATEQDLSQIHFMCTKGVLLRRNPHCFKLSCDLS